MEAETLIVDGNEATARVAYALSEVIAIYPITPSSTMGELADQWAAEGRPNAWGGPPHIMEMQSEAGVAGAIHGALQGGALATTFTASQGLLLMLPNMYKIAGELTPMVMHVAARSLAAQGLSIFGDHSDVMSARSTGYAMLASASVQEAQDMALIAHAVTLQARLPFIHFFDGFRTSHEVHKIAGISHEELLAFMASDLIQAHRMRALSPDHPVIRGTAQNPDVYFQGRESVNPYYAACPDLVQNTMDKLAALTGRQYRLFDYHGAPDAERVMVIMGSGGEAALESVDALNASGEKVGVLQVRLYRPFAADQMILALPPTVRALAVMDRCKEPGSLGEPLYLDVVSALHEAFAEGMAPFAKMPDLYGGRYGLSSKEFTPGMIKGVFDGLRNGMPRHFTVGIHDDVSHTSIPYDKGYSIEAPETVRAVFYGLGADGTVGANKNSIKIIGEGTSNHAQGYFVYDSKKSGSVTVSHLRFGPHPIRATYLIGEAGFVACHQFPFLERFDVLEHAAEGAVFLLNAPHGPEAVWEHLPQSVQQTILDKKLRFFVVDAYSVAQDNGMGRRINTVMQTCFFAISGVLPRDEAIDAIKKAIKKTYGRRGDSIVQKNWAVVDDTLAHLHEVDLKGKVVESGMELRPPVPAHAPAFVQEVTAKMIAGKGDELPVSAIPADGTWPTATTQYEKRNIAQEIPVWDPDICIQCGKCVMVCPHSVIRSKVADAGALENAPEGFKSVAAKGNTFKSQQYILQVAPEDCTGCRLCVEVCPVKNKQEVRLKAINMMPQAPLREQEVANWSFFEELPAADPQVLQPQHVKETQFLEPLFEFSGACAGCGETPYLKLMSQLFGDRSLIANATGCSSIYGGNLPTTPWSVNREGRGPAWANSLFEDNAEFGLGLRLALDKQAEYAAELLVKLADDLGKELVDEILHARFDSPDAIAAQRTRIEAIQAKLKGYKRPEAQDLFALAPQLVRKSVWIVGGDGWAYDIGFGGLDHVLASGRNVNILVLDTEVYSNTGGQQSKSTPRGAVAKFASRGKEGNKKDLGLIAMSYGQAYVAKIAMGAKDAHTVKAFMEAESYEGPSLIIAYSHCIAHGYDLARGMDQQALAVRTGHWPLYRFDPRLREAGKNPFQLDSKKPDLPLKDYIYNETRYNMLVHSNPERAATLLAEAQAEVHTRWRQYENLAAMAPEEANVTVAAVAAQRAADKEGS